MLQDFSSTLDELNKKLKYSIHFRGEGGGGREREELSVTILSFLFSRIRRFKYPGWLSYFGVPYLTNQSNNSHSHPLPLLMYLFHTLYFFYLRANDGTQPMELVVDCCVFLSFLCLCLSLSFCTCVCVCLPGCVSVSYSH